MIRISLLIYLCLMTLFTLPLFFTSASAEPRCWVGVIDHIDPPWLLVVGESSEEVTLSLDQAYADAKEGDWVIYWRKPHKIERLRSPLAAQATRDVKLLVERLSEHVERE